MFEVIINSAKLIPFVAFFSNILAYSVRNVCIHTTNIKILIDYFVKAIDPKMWLKKTVGSKVVAMLPFVYLYHTYCWCRGINMFLVKRLKKISILWYQFCQTSKEHGDHTVITTIAISATSSSKSWHEQNREGLERRDLQSWSCSIQANPFALALGASMTARAA